MISFRPTMASMPDPELGFQSPEPDRPSVPMDPVAEATARVPRVVFEEEAAIAGISKEENLAQVIARCPQAQEAGLRYTDLYEMLARENVSITMIKLFEDCLSFVVTGDCADSAPAVVRSLGMDCSVRIDLTMISLFSKSMRELRGVMATCLAALNPVKAEILQVSDSHCSLNLLVPSDTADTAIAALKSTFGLTGEDS